MTQLLIIKGENSGKIFPLEHNYLLGSGTFCNIILSQKNCPEKLLRFVKHEKQFQVELLDGKTSVYLNEAHFSSTPLAHGDLLHIGETLFLFNDEEELSDKDSQELDKPSSSIQKRRSYYDSDERILETFSTSDKNTQRLQTLYKIHSCITKNLEVGLMMKEILEIIFEEFHPLHGFILRYDPQTHQLFPLVQKGYPNQRPVYSTTILKEVISKKEAILSHDAKEDARFRNGHSVIEQDLSCTMCAPIIFNEKIFGVIQLDSKSSGTYSEQDLDQFSKVAAITAIAWDSAQNRQESQEFIQRLMLLSQGSQNLFSVLDFDQIRQHALQLCEKIFSFPINIFFQQNDQEIRISEAIGLDEKYFSQFTLSSHHPFLQKIWDTNTRQGNEIRILPGQNFPRSEGIFSEEMMLVLIPIGNTVASFFGFLLLAQKNSQFRFRPSDRELARILASQILVACQNATLHEAILKKNEEIAQWNQELEQRVDSRTKALQTAQKELAESEKMIALGRLSTGIAHEFNNMLTSMFGFAQMAKKSEEYKDRLVEMVLKQTRRGREITMGLLELHRETPILEENVDLGLLLTDLLQKQEKNFQKFQIKLLSEFPESLWISGDASRLKMAFFHLIRNAIDAMSEKGGTLTLSAVISDSQIQVIFQDTGMGIKPENFRKIFDPFYTTKGAFGGGKQEGIGFGLTYCQRIIKDHHGEIRVQSEFGSGSCFTVILPKLKD